MFKFGRKDKSKSEEKKKERKDSKKEKKNKSSVYGSTEDDGEGERYTPLQYPPPVTPKPTHSSLLGISLKNGSKSSTRGILKIRSSAKSKGAAESTPPVNGNIDDQRVLKENTRINEEMKWRTPDKKFPRIDRTKRESIHSITMNIAPPSVPPPASASEKVYGVNLELPAVAPPPHTEIRNLIVARQPKGDFGFNLRWAPYKDSVTGVTRQAVHAEPGSSGTKSGIIAGDRIVEINGSNVEHSTREQVIEYIQRASDSLKLRVQQIPEVSELNHRSASPIPNSVEHNEPTNGEISLRVNGHATREERFWLIHKGGYSSCQLMQPAFTDGRCKIKLEQGSHILEVDENDLEKVNPVSSDRCENLSSLAYLNESSLLHVLRQRYGSSLIHTVTGPSLLVINPNNALNVYSPKVMQMVRACKPLELPPHVYSKAQTVYQTMLSTSRDQSIVLTGRTGSGKTTTMKHILSYYAHTYGGIHSNSIDEKVFAASLVLESLGNCSTKENQNATRFGHQVTLDFDNHGHIASVIYQVSLLEKSRIVKVGDGELPFHIFSYVLHGTDAATIQELRLQSNTGTVKNNYMPSDDADINREAAISGWHKLDQALRVLAITPDESKIIQQVVAAIIHLGMVGVVKGSNNKAYFAEPAGAQIAARLLGVTIEELSKAIFSPSTVTSTSKSNLRPQSDELAAAVEALEGFIVGLYTELFNVVLSMINRSLGVSTRSPSSITITDLPGFKASGTEPANFDDLCFNYINERIQLLFHEKIFTENRERYIQENIDIEWDDVNNSPESMVQLLDKCTSQQLLQSTGNSTSRIDLSLLGRDDDADMGLLWLLDQLALTPGSSEQQLIKRLYDTHGSKVDQCEKLLTLHPQHPGMLTLNHCQGTAAVTYNTAGWIKACRNNPSAEQAANILNSSKRAGMADMFSSMTSSMIGSFTSTASRGEGTLRRTLVNHAGVKRRSQAILLKYQTDSLIETLTKTGVHFISHIVPSPSSQGTGFVAGEMVLDVPYIRVQLRGMELLPAIRYHRQGYPEHMTFGDFISRYSLLSGKNAAHTVPLMDQKAVVEEMLSVVDVDKSQYKIGLSQIFLRPAALAHLDDLRELRRSFYAIVIQKHIRRYLAQKAITRLKLKHEAMRCVQKNIRIHFKLRDWQWWKLYTKIKPLVNVQKTEEDLKVKETELLELKAQLQKVDQERGAYKKECARLEDEVVRFKSEYNQERQVARQAVELLEQETTSKLTLESQLDVIQTRHEEVHARVEELEHVNEELRQVNDDYDEAHLDQPDAVSSISHYKFEHMIKEAEIKRRQQQSEHEEELEILRNAKHKQERQLNEMMLERDDQTQQIQNLKKKVQKFSNEAQDLKRQYEDGEARNAELMKKQRRFDIELQNRTRGIAGEENMKDTLQRERDQLLKQKYVLSQQCEDITLDRDALQSKLRRLEHEMTELKSSGSHGDSEVIQLRSTKHELERRLAEAEDEMSDMQQELHETEMAKLKFQMEVDKAKQKHQKETDQLERDLEELRDIVARKSRGYESRIAELEDELHEALQGKREAERRLLDVRNCEPVRDQEHEKELKIVIRRLRALLIDAQSQIEKSKEQANQKSHFRAMETQIEDLQSSLTAVLKSKQSLEVELQESHHMVSSANKSKMETEDKVTRLMRDKTDIENEKEDLDEEIHELLKRYNSLVSQNSVTLATLRGQTDQISTLVESKNRLQDELDTVNSRLAHVDSHCVPKDRLVVLESKCMEMEQKLDYEKSLRVRFENQAIKAKDACERLDDEISKLTSKISDEERRSRQFQSQLTRALETQEEVSRKDVEQTQLVSSLNQRLEICEAEIHHLQSELKSAQKRAEHLKSTLEQSTLSDEDENGELSSDSEDGYS